MGIQMFCLRHVEQVSIQHSGCHQPEFTDQRNNWLPAIGAVAALERAKSEECDRTGRRANLETPPRSDQRKSAPDWEHQNPPDAIHTIDLAIDQPACTILKTDDLVVLLRRQ